MTGSDRRIAHFNWGYLKAPWGDPLVAEFEGAVDLVNAIAERSPGFVARPELDDMEIERELLGLVRVPKGTPDVNCFATTLSLWESVPKLFQFVANSVHGRFMAKRADWFIPQGVANYVIWEVTGDQTPDLAEARARMDHLISAGPGPYGFDFKWFEDALSTDAG